MSKTTATSELFVRCARRMFGASVAFLLGFVSPTSATTPPPLPTTAPVVCGALLAHIVPLNPDGRGAALAYVMSLLPIRGDAGYVSGTISLYDAASRWDVSFRDAVAAGDGDAGHSASPIVVRFPEPVRIDAAHLAFFGGADAGPCIPVSTHVVTESSTADKFTLRLLAAAAAVAPIDAGKPISDPAPACAIRNVPAKTTYAAQAVPSGTIRISGGTGRAVIRVTLADDGAILDTTVYESAGSPGPDIAALQAANGSTFAPAVSNCRKVGGIYAFLVEFHGG